MRRACPLISQLFLTALILGVSLPVRAQTPPAAAASEEAGAGKTQPDIDLEQVKTAFWSLKGAGDGESLQAFETAVNKVYFGQEGQVSVGVERVSEQGSLLTTVTGYLDQDQQPGFNPQADKLLFKLVQLKPVAGAQLDYELYDGFGNVFFRGAQPLPQGGFFQTYFRSTQPVPRYFTPRARLGVLRSQLVVYRGTPAYLGWRTRFNTYRRTYARAVVTRLRTTYGAPRASVVLRPRVNITVKVNTTVNVTAKVKTPVTANARATTPPARVTTPARATRPAGTAPPKTRAATPAPTKKKTRTATPVAAGTRPKAATTPAARTGVQ